MALDRLRGMPQPGVSILISGAAGASAAAGSLVLVTSGADILRLTTQDPGSVPPWVYYADAKIHDRVTLDIDNAGNIDTAGGNDRLTIRATGAVESVTTGNDSDSVSITADEVNGVSLDVYADPITTGSGVLRPGDDVAQITARAVASIHSGGGDDRIVIAAQEVFSVGADDGDDQIAVAARMASGISGGSGDDRLTLDIGRGETEGDLFSVTPFAAGVVPEHAAFRTDVYGGSGNDTISAAIGTQLGIEAGSGDDSIAIASGRAALVWTAGDGNDRVTLGAGAEVVLRLERMAGYIVERDADSLTLRLGSGSIRFEGLGQSGFIAISLGWGKSEVLHAGAMLDRRV